jgi:hypothetical protein
MSESFIAPEGAVRFVVEGFPGKVVWVFPNLEELERNIHCKCKMGYRMVPGSALAVGLDTDAREDDESFVCSCLGRIIE